MSLFGSVMRDMEGDPVFGAHSRMMNQMNRMMNSMFGGGAFGGGMGMPMGMGNMGMLGGMGHEQNQMMPFGPQMSPFGHMGGFPQFDQLMTAGDGNSHSFSSMSVTSVSSGPDGRPQVYQASKQTAMAPGGIRETRKAVMDSRSGTKKLAVGRHIGDQGHVREREENVYTGQREENEEFVNLDETEAVDFNRTWRQRAYGGGYSHSASMPAITGVDHHPQQNNGHRYHSGRQEIGYPTRPSESTSTVTIEELPPSDDEEQINVSLPHPQPQPTTSSSRRCRSPYAREKKSKSKRAKKN